MQTLAFLGSKQAGLNLCAQLLDLLPLGTLEVIACPDDRQDTRSVHDGFAQLAAKAGVPLVTVSSRAETRALLDRLSSRLVLVLGWYQIIEVERYPEKGFFGFHYSPLPRYRGNAPIVWQILRGESSIGISFFRFTAGMDEGDLVDQASFPLALSEDVGDALARADDLMLDMARRHVPLLLQGQAKLYPQPDEVPSYCGLRTPEDGLIDWNGEADVVLNFIRAQAHPYPGAFSFMADGRRLTIWRALPEPRCFHGVPGGIAEISDKYVVVTTRRGALRLLCVQPEGGEACAASAVLRSLRDRLGRMPR